MDGFHLTTKQLVEKGRLPWRGAPDTFDALHFVKALRRLADPSVGEMFWPTYSRLTDEPIPDAIAVPTDVKLVFVEGNYLLLNDPPWNEIREVVAPIWYLEADLAVLERRLIRRQLLARRTREEAERHVYGSDMLNVAAVERAKAGADRYLRITPTDPLLQALEDPATGEVIQLDDS
jgi:pantothenate kinase